MIISNRKLGAKKLPNSYHSEIKVIFIEKNYWSYKKWKLNKIYCFKRFYVFLKAYLLLLRYIKTFVKYKPIKTLLGRIYFCEILFAGFPKKSANLKSRYKYHPKSHCGQIPLGHFLSHHRKVGIAHSKAHLSLPEKAHS